MIHKSFGKIKYDPVSSRSTFKKWWVIIQCDPEIVKYYQHIFYKLYWKKLQTACWNSHISVVRGEKPLHEEAWKKFDGKLIEFQYKYPGYFHSNNKHYWINAWSPEFAAIRKSLGLIETPPISYHISIGSLSQ